MLVEAKGNRNYVTHVMTELISLVRKIFHKYCAMVIVTTGPVAQFLITVSRKGKNLAGFL